MKFSLPEVMFLPLAVPSLDGFGDVDAGVVARRIPDFVRQVLNQGQHGPTGLLEVVSPPDELPVTWELFDSAPEAEEAFAMLPPGEPVRAVVSGEVLALPEGLRVEFHCFFAEEVEEGGTNRLGAVISYADPLAGLLPLLRRLARMLELPYHEPPPALMTSDGRAFLLFLRGLDNAILLSGDLDIEAPQDGAALLQPFAEALVQDPQFGLALRMATSTLALALAEQRLGMADLQRFMDRCYALSPSDGEGCVAVAEQLSELGDDQRAIAWLQLATHLDPPPPRGLEHLGILFANRGDTKAARELWQRGIDVDGHPHFFAHLARLEFSEGRQDEAWRLLLRGLFVLHERSSRSGEWDEPDRGAGVLLPYLREHLEAGPAPPELDAALLCLRGLLEPEDRIELGACLGVLGRGVEARHELKGGLEAESIEPLVRDQGVRALLRLSVIDFERRFARAVEQALRGRKPRACLEDLQLFLDLQPDFWPALFYSAVAKRRMGQHDEALDLFDEALRIHPDQPDVLQQMARLFDARGNPKRALELIDQALDVEPEEPQLLAAKVTFLTRLARGDAARLLLHHALALHGEDKELLRLRRKLGA